MTCQELLEQKLRAFETRPDCPLLKERIEAGWRALERFRRDYPCDRPGSIEKLTPDRVYNPGPDNDYFFLWIGWRLAGLGRPGVGDAHVFQNAADRVTELAQLLRIGVSSESIAGKIDAPWQNIPGFGGDKQIAKKIVASYYPDQTLPIFNTDHLEFFAKYLLVNIDAESRRKFGLGYADVTLKVGRKWELLCEALLERKEHHKGLRNQDNVYFMYVLYCTEPAPLPNNLVCLDRLDLAMCDYPRCRRR